MWSIRRIKVIGHYEKPRRVKKDLLKTRNHNIVLVCLNSGQEIPSRLEPTTYAHMLLKSLGHCCGKRAELSSGQMVFVSANVARGIKPRSTWLCWAYKNPTPLKRHRYGKRGKS